MTLTRERRIAVYLLVFVAILAVVGGSMTQSVDAKGRTKTKTTLSISKRVGIQTDNCESAGGEISVSYAYEDDGSESATTSCSGGLLDGNVCINEATTIECYQAGRMAPTGHLGDTVPLVPITDVQAVEPTPTPGLEVNAVSTTPLVVSDGDASSDDGMSDLPQAGEGTALTAPVVSSGQSEPVEQPGRLPNDTALPKLLPLN